ncbi:MAG TPA: GNAT family N-acetyltransferase, partial [Chthoniobacterales bacterium]
RHFEKPQSTLVLDGGLRQPGKSEAILPTEEEDESMRVKRNRHLWGRERSSDRPAHDPTGLSFYPLTPDRWDDFEVLFGPRGACAGCRCMWWRLTSREFREGAGTANRDKFRECVREPTAPGVLAYRGQAAVGWCAVAPREKYRRLASSRTLQPIDDTPVWTITCLYVAKGERRQGLTRRLIEAACDFAARFGAPEIEAYPRISSAKESNPLSIYMGTEGSFVRAGFCVVAEPTPIRRIMRKRLSR